MAQEPLYVPTVGINGSSLQHQASARPDYSLTASRSSKNFDPLLKLAGEVTRLQQQQAVDEADARTLQRANQMKLNGNAFVSEMQTKKSEDGINFARTAPQAADSIIRSQEQTLKGATPREIQAFKEASENFRTDLLSKAEGYAMQETFNFNNQEMQAAIDLKANDLLANFDNPYLRAQYRDELIQQVIDFSDYNGINPGSEGSKQAVLKALDSVSYKAVDNLIDAKRFGDARNALNALYKQNKNPDLTAESYNELNNRLKAAELAEWKSAQSDAKANQKQSIDLLESAFNTFVAQKDWANAKMVMDELNKFELYPEILKVANQSKFDKQRSVESLGLSEYAVSNGQLSLADAVNNNGTLLPIDALKASVNLNKGIADRNQKTYNERNADIQSLIQSDIKDNDTQGARTKLEEAYRKELISTADFRSLQSDINQKRRQLNDELGTNGLSNEQKTKIYEQAYKDALQLRQEQYLSEHGHKPSGEASNEIAKQAEFDAIDTVNQTDSRVKRQYNFNERQKGIYIDAANTEIVKAKNNGTYDPYRAPHAYLPQNVLDQIAQQPNRDAIISGIDSGLRYDSIGNEDEVGFILDMPQDRLLTEFPSKANLIAHMSDPAVGCNTAEINRATRAYDNAVWNRFDRQISQIKNTFPTALGEQYNLDMDDPFIKQNVSFIAQDMMHDAINIVNNTVKDRPPTASDFESALFQVGAKPIYDKQLKAIETDIEVMKNAQEVTVETLDRYSYAPNFIEGVRLYLREQGYQGTNTEVAARILELEQNGNIELQVGVND